MISNYDKLKPLSSSQKKELKKEWDKYANSKSFLIFNQYLKDGENISDYIPWNIFYSN